MDVRRGTIGGGSLKYFPLTEACIIAHFDCDDLYVWETASGCLEADVVNSYYESVFVLVIDNGASVKGTCLARGYTPLSGKDQDELCGCLGARVVYDEVLGKTL